METKRSRKFGDFIKKYWVVFFAVMLIIAMALSSVQIYKEEILKIDPNIEYEEQNTLYLSSERIDTLNPVISKSEDVYFLSRLIYSSLFSYDENLGVIPDLVESYEVNTERAFVEITLKDKIKWHNGDNLRANDIVFTINAMKYAGAACPYYDKIRKINSVFARSNSTVTIYFNNNYDCSLEELIFPIIPSGQYGSYSQFVSAADNFKPVGTGQYMYKSYNKLKQLSLSPNKNYYGKKAKKKISVTLLPDRDLSINMMEINSVSCYLDSSSGRKSVANDRKFKIYDFPSNQVEFLVFNTANKYLSSKNIRHAVAYGIDTQNILESAYMGDGILTDTIYYPNFLGVMDTHSYYNFDRDKANELLKTQGYEDKNGDGYLEGVGEDEITFRILVNKKDATRNSAARIIKKNLEQIGINSNIISLSNKEYKAAINNKQFDILVVGYTIEENYDLRDFFNRKNEWGYYNYNLFMKARELDRLYTPEEMKEKYSELKEDMMETLPYYPLCYKKMSLIGVPNFEADALPMFNDIYKNCDTWKWSIATVKGDGEDEVDEKDKNDDDKTKNNEKND